MILPIDIEKKEFSRDKRGFYNATEVDTFLDLIIVDYEKVLQDNRSMAHKIKFLEKTSLLSLFAVTVCLRIEHLTLKRPEHNGFSNPSSTELMTAEENVLPYSTSEHNIQLLCKKY